MVAQELGVSTMKVSMMLPRVAAYIAAVKRMQPPWRAVKTISR